MSRIATTLLGGKKNFANISGVVANRAMNVQSNRPLSKNTPLMGLNISSRSYASHGSKKPSDIDILHYIITNKDASALSEFLSGSSNITSLINSKEHKITPLMTAIMENDLEKFRILIGYGADPFVTGVEGLTTLHMVQACQSDRIKDSLAEEFFKGDADYVLKFIKTPMPQGLIEALNKAGQKRSIIEPLEQEKHNEYVEQTRLKIDNAAQNHHFHDPKGLNRLLNEIGLKTEGRRLVYVLKMGSMNAFKVLMQRGDYREQSDFQDSLTEETPLTVVISNNKYNNQEKKEIVEELLKYGASLIKPGKDNKTPMQFAEGLPIFGFMEDILKKHMPSNKPSPDNDKSGPTNNKNGGKSI